MDDLTPWYLDKDTDGLPEEGPKYSDGSTFQSRMKELGVDTSDLGTVAAQLEALGYGPPEAPPSRRPRDPEKNLYSIVDESMSLVHYEGRTEAEALRKFVEDGNRLLANLYSFVIEEDADGNARAVINGMLHRAVLVEAKTG